MTAARMTGREIDAILVDPAFAQDPYSVYDVLRDQHPVYWSETWGVWVLTRYDDTLLVLRDHASFSNSGRFAALIDQLPASVQDEVGPLRQHYASGLIQSDPPDHTRLRNLLRLAFTPRAIEAFRDQVERIAGELLADGESAAEIDIVRDIAYPLPVYVICQMLGIPADQRDRIYQWNIDLGGLQATGGAAAANARAATAAVIDMEDFFGRLIDERRTSPQDDLITSMVRAQDDGDQLSRDELISACVTLLLAGHETTKNLISNGVLTLLRRPEVAQSIRDEPALVDSAVEEILRYESPIQRGWRRVARDTVVRGQTVRAGQLVYYMFGAANRDPDVFSDPSAFRVDRTPNRHLGFGYGIHFCLGAALARMEGSVLFATLLARYPEASLVTDAITWQQNVHVRCPTMLRVSLGARAT